MKVLITGGAGFIGSHITDCFIKEGHSVSIIDNLVSGKKIYINEKAEFYDEDIRKDIIYIFEKENPDIVIHAAGHTMLRNSLINPVLDADTNILGTINILEACRKNQVKKLIYTSTGGARYGEPEYLPVDEKHPKKPNSPYGLSKYIAEKYVELYNKLYGLEYLIFCFGNVYGPRDDPNNKRVIPVFCDNIINKKSPTIYGDGNQTRDFIYVVDLAKFILNSINKIPKNKIFNLANSKQISVNEIFNIIKKVSGFDGNPIYKNPVKGEIRDMVLDTSLAEKELKWKPEYTYIDGITETYDWFENV